MKDFIKDKLREGMKLNIIGVAITRPEQNLIIMRGPSGSGKSTIAKQLVGEGVIHSTDDCIAEAGDYNEFFRVLKESNNSAPLSKMHSLNLSRAKKSMLSGISPVIIDNTNLRANESKAYVVGALNMGFDENNITIVEVNEELSPEILAERNTHGVPLDKVTKMVQRYKSIGKLTVKKILESKDMTPSNVLYSAVVLDEESRSRLLEKLGNRIPEGWKVIAHHMTISFGKPLPRQEDLGKTVMLDIDEIGLSDMAFAVRVSGYPSNNNIPHITIAINPDGGKPQMSNDITKWYPTKGLFVRGIVTEIKNG